MKLRCRIFLRIIILLFFQISIISGVVIFTFTQHVYLNSRESLISAWNDAKNTFEQLKHEYYLNIYFVNDLLNFILDENGSLKTEQAVLFEYFYSSSADLLFIKDEKNKLLLKLNKNLNYNPVLFSLIDNSNYRFAYNEFLVLSNQANNKLELFLITGKRYNKIETKKIYIYLVKKIDYQFLNSLFSSSNLNIGIFFNDNFITANLPVFNLPAKGEFSFKLNQTPFYGFAEAIAYLSGRPLYLGVLKSIIKDQIYINEIIINLGIIFLISLFLSFSMAVGMTTQVLSPLSRLNEWMKNYLRSRSLPPLLVYPKDEIGFMAETFHNMIIQIIREEQIINNQLKEITFLNRYNELVLSNLQAGVLVVDESKKIEYANAYISALLQIEPYLLYGENLNTFLEKYFKSSHWNEKGLLLDLTHKSYLSDIFLKDSSKEPLKFVFKIIPLFTNNETKKALIMLEDITKTEHLWQKILIQEKIASLAIISAGLAHEINNPLGAILSHLQFLQTIERDPDKLESLNWIKQETNRLSSLVNKVLTFSRPNPNTSSELNSLVSEASQLFQYDYKRLKINLALELEREPLWLGIEADYLKQALVNLIINAIQAMSNGGVLSLITQKTKDGIAQLIIQDTGEGIESKYFKNLFTPFFTTREKEKGIGLGLCISYSIIKRAGGEINIKSEKNKGTIIEIRFPLLKKEEGYEYFNYR